MTDNSLMLFARISACNARVEAMKAENEMRKIQNLIKQAEYHVQHGDCTNSMFAAVGCRIIAALVARVRELELIHTDTGVVSAEWVRQQRRRADEAEQRVRELESALNCEQMKSASYCEALVELADSLFMTDDAGEWIPEGEYNQFAVWANKNLL